MGSRLRELGISGEMGPPAATSTARPSVPRHFAFPPLPPERQLLRHWPPRPRRSARQVAVLPSERAPRGVVLFSLPLTLALFCSDGLSVSPIRLVVPPKSPLVSAPVLHSPDYLFEWLPVGTGQAQPPLCPAPSDILSTYIYCTGVQRGVLVHWTEVLWLQTSN